MTLKHQLVRIKALCFLLAGVALAAFLPGSVPVRADRVDRSVTKPVIRLSAGRLHSAMILQDGSLYLWGDNTYGQLGISGVDYLDEPQPVRLPGDAVDVSLGSDHTLVLTEDGSVYAMGRNTFGQLGNQSTLTSDQPVKVEGLPVITAVAAGAWHSMALAADGSVWGWGDNSNWQLGEPQGQAIQDASGNTVGYRHTSPVRLVLSGAVDIAAGGQFSLYIRQDGQLLAWGDNSRGQLGDGTLQIRSRPTAVTGLKAVRQVSAGYQHVLAVVNESDADVLYIWGDHSAGQLGLADIPAGDTALALPQRLDVSETGSHIVLISAGYAHSVAVLAETSDTPDAYGRNQQILVWGDNSFGQLSLGHMQQQTLPVAVGGTYNQHTGDRFLPFAAVASGSFHTLVLSSKGLLAASGRGDRGQLGTRSVVNRNQFASVHVPDQIRPGWPETAALAITRLDDGRLRLRWPAAQDNIRVAGYRLLLHWSNGTVYREEVGLEQHHVIADLPDAQETLALHAGVYAYDEAGRQLADTELSRLLAFLPPLNAPDAVLPDYFKAPTEPAHLIQADRHLWRPNTTGLMQVPEVPWDVTSVYGPEMMPEPPSFTWLIAFSAAAAVASLFALTVFLALQRKQLRAKQKKLVQAHITIRRI